MDTHSNQSRFVPVILAGGSGTRFWPRSRKANAKQVLALIGERTMIQQTLDRLRPLSSPDDFVVITNQLLEHVIRHQLPELQKQRVICEPCARNTAAACALAAMIVARETPDAVLGVFPSDHVVVDEALFQERVRAGIELARSGENIVVFGVPPTRPETGYGYIEQATHPATPAVAGINNAYAVRRFTEKPDTATAQYFLEAGCYLWNSGIFLWRADTLCNAIREHCPAMLEPLQRIAEAFGSPEFDAVFSTYYPTLENISIDYAVLEPRSKKGEGHSGILCLPADFGWNDLGSWNSLHEHLLEQAGSNSSGNVIEAMSSIEVSATGNYVFSPDKTVALLGVDNLVVVQTEDAILITARCHSQQVGQVVAELARTSRHDLI